MEENKDNTAEDIKKVEGAGTADTQTADKNKDEGTGTDTKAEAQKLADGMLAKKLKGMPTKEELKAFKEWQESQKTAEQKQAEKETEYANTQKELSDAKKELAVYKAGVKNADDAEFVTFKVSKLEGDFNENLAKFLKDNPKYLGTEETKIVKKVGSSLNLGGKQTTSENETNQTMNSLIRSVRD